MTSNSNILHEGVPHPEQDGSHGQRTFPPLFAGQKLWFHHQIPQRKWLVDNAKQYGATVVGLDKQADIKLVDHAKKNNAPGTHSYKYVEFSIRKGRLESLADHAVGVATSAARPVGSTVTAPRTGRMHFTSDEDQFLWNWVKPFESRGGPSKGNEIYKQIERVNPRHTWQSWRERWLKITQFQRRQIASPAEEVQDRPEEQATESSHASPPRKKRRAADDEGDWNGVAQDQQQTQRLTTVAPSMRALGQVSSSASGRQGFKIVEGVNPPEQPPQTSVPTNAPERGNKRPAPSRLDSTVSTPRTPFTVEEYTQLYHMVPKLTNISIEHFHKSWADVASSSDHQQHTAEEWERFWIFKVVPDYCNKKGLPIEEVAPYLVDQPEKISTAVSPVKEVDKGESHVTRTDYGPRTIVCSNCFTAESNKWRFDKERNPLCNPCAVFLRTHGVPRPSMNAGAGCDGEERTLPVTKTPSATSRWHDLTVVTPSSTYVNRAVQTSSLNQKEEAGPDETAFPRSRRSSPPPKSPSFQPDSPTLERRPEPNEARKRSAGRGTQSQSTESSNNPDSQATAQASFSSVFEAAMGEVQSTQRDTQHEERSETQLHETSAATSTFQFPSNIQENRPSLLDDPRNLDTAHDFCLGPDRGPPRDRPDAHLTGLEENATVWGPQTQTSVATPVRSQPDESTLFIPEHDEDDEEDYIEAGGEGASTTDNHYTSVSPTSRSDSEPDAKVDHGEPSHNVLSWATTGQYETGQESLEAWETAPDNQHMQANRRATTQELLEDPKIGSNALDLELELPEPEGGWDTILGSTSSHLYAEYSEISNLNVQESETLDASDPDANVEIERDIDKELHLLSPPPPGTRSLDAESNADDEEEARKVDDWMALQRSLHPQVKNIQHLLFKALESTTFDLVLATTVVDIMLEKLMRPTLRRRSHVVAADEIEVPQDLKGVWTEEDDNLLTSTNTRDIERVLDKHGREGCDARFEYLDKVAET
ncbi:hypothetical protein A1O3_02612 [Capronia epimyces CBS 606.96]|uniref:DNA-binding protein RAP1 n=1 Tax=Capronia epimyces CBS 606.96 TaxID=1182542 RepID=W9YIP4_9EURO|nr:uncharacterized protein A1O3_02612 [Capronia epimyces CBS 606.96]EXJ89545.1 hypothetical protein A1O3_02612 [Capronia epimyces CBS 606.96]